MPNDKQPIILFDGICKFCNYWVNFAIKHDPKKNLRFTPFQSEAGQALLQQYQIDFAAINSVILIEKGGVYRQSTAALRICRYLNGGWKIFYSFLIIPRFIRDFLYNIIARNRYRFFGINENCMVPTPDVRERFLD
jgi:predicted DCC family thiol-disulfide oxidoreductase YuxK